LQRYRIAFIGNTLGKATQKNKNGCTSSNPKKEAHIRQQRIRCGSKVPKIRSSYQLQKSKLYDRKKDID